MSFTYVKLNSEDMSALVVPLERALDLSEHGGKAVGLARLMQAGLPVPQGIVVAYAALKRVLAGIGAHDGLEGPADRLMGAAIPQGLSEYITANAVRLAEGEPLAVRSSAAGEDGCTASFAGLLETVLGVNASADLEAAVRKVWVSRWSERARAYQRGRNAPLAGMGVIVQRQIDARYSGVLFTVSPEPGGEDEMLCEYDEGLGNRLVAGDVTPGRLTISRTTLALAWQRDLDSGAVRPSAACIGRLAAAAQEAERLFGSPQDIEWAIDGGGRVWLLQSRPITTRAAKPVRSILWSNANVNENFPEPISPLLYSIAAAGYTSYFRSLGAAFGVSSRRLRAMDRDLRTIIGVHAGRMYYNLTSIHAVLRGVPFGGVLARWFDEFVGAAGPAPASDAQRKFSLGEAAELVRIVASTTRQYLFLGSRLQEFEASVERYAARTSHGKLAGKSLLELRDDLRAFLDIRLHGWTGAGLSDTAAMVCYGALKALLARSFPETEHAQLHHELLKGLDDLASAGPVDPLWDLSRRIRADDDLRVLFASHSPEEIADELEQDARYAAFHRALHGYLETWGYRFSGELMLTVPSFQERPQQLLAILARYATQEGESPSERLEAQRADRLAHTKRALATLSKRRLLRGLPWPSQAMLARRLIAAAQTSIAYRERARLKQALLYNRLRGVALAIGERLVREQRLAFRDDVFFLTATELDELLSGTAMFPQVVSDLVALRKRAHGEFAAMQPADVLTAAEGEYPRCTDVAKMSAASSDVPLTGTSVCGGIAVGRARVLSNVAEACELTAGDILVTRQTDPGWATAFVAIRGLVLERGGMLSHGAILAREYGIPTVVGVRDATVRIQDGVTARVDGDHGVIEILR